MWSVGGCPIVVETGKCLNTPLLCENIIELRIRTGKMREKQKQNKNQFITFGKPPLPPHEDLSPTRKVLSPEHGRHSILMLCCRWPQHYAFFIFIYFFILPENTVDVR